MNILLKGENKLKKSGFTMIELLAIITVLATILLVSFPTLINVTRRDKERQYNDMTNTLCKAGETYIYENQDLYPELKDEEGVFYLRISELVENELVNKSETNPKTKKTITNNLLKYEVKSDRALNCTYIDHSLGTLLKDNGDGILSVGDKYEYEVKPGEKQKFYVLKVEDDKVNLIMDRNICEDGTTDYTEDNDYCRVSWYGTSADNYNKKGPLDAMTYVGNATRKWKNVPNVNIEYDDKKENELLENDWTYGYIGITLKEGIGYITNKDGTKTAIELEDNMPIKARLAKATELKTEYTNCTINNGSCDTWLVENLKYWSGSNNKYSINSEYIEGTPIYNITGYWLMSSAAQVSFTGYFLYDHGNIIGDNTYLTNRGVRPVITVPKSDLLN